MRNASVQRNTAETQVRVTLNLDGTGKSSIQTGVGFLDHMLNLFTVHGLFDLSIECHGDTCVDDHHSVEDIAICLGQAFREALGEKRGIRRYGEITLPMDEALIQCVIDLSGRGYLVNHLLIPSQKVGSFDTELVQEFFYAFAINGGITLHLRQLDGINSHHIIEAAFKAAGRAVRIAAETDPRAAGSIPSSKGVIA